MKKIKINYIEDLENLNILDNNEEYYISLETNLDFEDINSYKSKTNYYRFIDSKILNGFNVIDMKNKVFIFNGNNNSISNLFIQRKKENNVGLFKNINNSVIKNLRIENAYVKGKIKVGILSGTMEGKIKNLHITGKVEGSLIVGGIVGESINKITFIDNNISTTTIGGCFVGGILGKGEESSFINNEISGRILYSQIYNEMTVNEYSGCSVYNNIEEKEYRNKPFISYKGIVGLILK